MSEGTAAQRSIEPGLHEAPSLNYELEPWGRSFGRNLADLLLRREPPPVEITAEPAPVPPDTFVETGLNWRSIAESYGGHVVFVAIVYLVCTLPIFGAMLNQIAAATSLPSGDGSLV